MRKLLRGLREVRMAKLRSGVEVLDAAGGIRMNGVGGLEVGEGRSFITGVIDGLRYAATEHQMISIWLTTYCRKIGASREQQRKDRDAEEAENGYSGTAGDYDDDEMDMQ